MNWILAKANQFKMSLRSVNNIFNNAAEKQNFLPGSPTKCNQLILVKGQPVPKIAPRSVNNFLIPNLSWIFEQ